MARINVAQLTQPAVHPLQQICYSASSRTSLDRLLPDGKLNVTSILQQFFRHVGEEDVEQKHRVVHAGVVVVISRLKWRIVCSAAG